MQQEKIIPIIESSKPQLSTEDRVHMWQMIEQTLPVSRPVPSIYSQYLFSSFVNKKYMTAFLIALLIVAGGSGTALASDASRPGDLLFPLERTLENVRLRLAFSEESRIAFENSLTEERLQELREIIDEEIIISPSNIVDGTTPTLDTTSSSTLAMLRIEADVFTDTTVIKIELGDQKFYFETDKNTQEEVIASIQQKFSMLTEEQIVHALSFEIEDRESRPKDRGIATFSTKGTERVNTAVQEILSFIDKTSDLTDSHRTTLLSVIENEMNDFVDVDRKGKSTHIGDSGSQFEIKMDDDGDSRLEIRDENTRIRVEQKDGEVRIRTKQDDEKSDDTRIDSDTVSSLSIEVDIFTDTTIVKIETGNEDFTFETSSQTRDEIISVIQKKLPALTREQISHALSIEVKPRANKPETAVVKEISGDTSTRIDDDRDQDERDGDRDDNEDDEDKEDADKDEDDDWDDEDDD